MPGDEWQQFANLRLFLGFMYSHPGKKLLFMGSEFGQKNEWNFRTELDWREKDRPLNSKLVLYVKDLNRIFLTLPEFHEVDFSYEGFEWIDFKDSEQSVISYIRKSKDGKRLSLIVCNMTPVPRNNYRIGVPRRGYYREILNSDAKDYGGSGVGNMGGMYSDSVPWQDRPFSLNLSLPPLGIVIFESTSLENN
jgi:1,4-alpha-glucan branching enzyme